MKKIGLRIDVDTFQGTKNGVPTLLKILKKYHIKGTFFFTVGPDNMGRHIYRLLRPKFLWKILRTKAISIYDWKIILAGIAWPGKQIGKNLSHIIKKTFDEGHEIGFHAWDHYNWQMNINKWSRSKLFEQIELGVDILEKIIGSKIKCSATAGWKTNLKVLEIKEYFKFDYNSDCRGTHLFRPILNNKLIGTLQIPVTLPTYDEVIGSVVKDKYFNDFIINTIKNNQEISIYTIHSEIEGMSKSIQFKELLKKMIINNMQFCNLREFIPNDKNHLPKEKIVYMSFPGRDGCLGYQQKV